MITRFITVVSEKLFSLEKDVINVYSSESPIGSHCGTILYAHARKIKKSHKMSFYAKI